MAENSFMIWKTYFAEMIQKYIKKKMHHRNMILLISRHPYLPLSYIEKYRFIPWDVIALQSHPNMTAKFYRRFLQRENQFRPYRRKHNVYFQGIQFFDFRQWERSPYRKTFLSYHPKLPINLVIKFSNMGWDFTFLLLYRKWKIRQIERLIQCRKMDWVLYSRNPFLSCEIIRHFLRYPWDWGVLATHPCFPPQDIYQDNILFCRWKWKQVFKNPRISYDFWCNIRKTQSTNPFPDSYIILHNKFQYDGNIQLWATFKITSCISLYLERKRMKYKLRFLIQAKHRLCDDIVRSDIFTFL